TLITPPHTSTLFPYTTLFRSSQKLVSPIFSPATKAESGHDENITYDQMRKDIGDDLATKLRDASLELYKYASDFSARRGLILARSEEHTSELQSRENLVCRLL